MNLRRIVAGITAAACSTGILVTVPELVDTTYAAEVVYNGFETDYEGWYGEGDWTELTAVSGAGYNNSRGMVITGRTTPEDGARSSKGFYLEGGKEYDYNFKVYSETDETFHITLLYIDNETEEETVVELVNQDVKAGEWTSLSAEYKAPANTYEYRLSITTDTTNDFSFDEVLITEQRSKNVVYAAPSGKGLKDEFGDYFRVGNILNGNTVRNSTILADYIKDYNAIECENETKPDATLVQNGSSNTNIKVSLNSCSAIADFCVKNGIGFRGHTLVWHSQTPQWFFKSNFQDSGSWVDKNTMNQRMESYIKNMFNAFATQYPSLDLYAYDVCNECVSDDSNRTSSGLLWGPRVGGYGNGASPWVQIYGDNSFVEQAFTYADKYAPESCKLFYNDYNEYWDHKRDTIYKMCKSLYQKGVLDGVGMQSHVPANSTGFAGTDSYIQAMKLYLSIGCEVQITELDISLKDNNTVKYNNNDQAKKFTDIAKAAIDWNKNPQGTGRVTLYQIWGPNDANSWLSSGSNGTLRDGNNQPKTAYNSMYSVLPDSEWGTGLPYRGPGSSNFQPKVWEPDSNGYWFHDTFEGSTCDWSGRSATVELSGRTNYENGGKEALLTEERTAGWNGCTKTLNTNAFKPGESYSFSVNTMYFDGPDTRDFKFTLQYTGADGETYYDQIAAATAPVGEWVQLSNTSYKIPSGASDLQIYVETSDETTDNFYIDDAYGAVDGTVIKGAGVPKIRKVVLGDVDFDEAITSADLALAKNGLIKGGFSDNMTKKAADVDQNGVLEIADIVQLTEFLIGDRTEFEKAVVVVDFTEMNNLFSSVSVNSSWKLDGENNPLYTQRFGADPGFMVYNDRLYVYTTNDAFEYSNGQMKENSYDVGTINCCSSADLVNWTDHGAIPVAGKNKRTTNGVAKWANCSWAPDACWKKINGKDKFFLYFANSGGGIGVLTADSPTGPWSDPLGHALLTGSSPNCSDVVWMFDPGVMVDDDGTGYLFFGGGVDGRDKADPGTGRCVKLGADMISLAENPVKMSTPYLFEDSSIIKLGNTYYYSYCSNWNVPGGTSINGQSFGSGDICYMTSSSPLGPYNFGGRVFANTGGQGLDKGGNNHHSIVSFKNKLYVLYHTRIVENRQGINLNYRSPSISEATNNNGKLSCSGSHKGVSAVGEINPYETVQAETMSNQSKGITVNGLQDTTVHGTKGEWIKTSRVNFTNGSRSLTMRASSANGAVIKVCSGSAKGEAVAYVKIEAGSSMNDITVKTNTITDMNDLYFVFSGDADIDSWQFS